MTTTLAAQAVGSTVTLKVDGSDTAFLVVHQGNPDPGVYDASCEGTWLLMKDVYTERVWDNRNDYAASLLHAWLNGAFLELLDSGIRQAVKTVKLPYADGSGVHSGGAGVSAQAFLLSMREMGTPAAQKAGLADEGALLDYFADGDGGEDPLRAAALGGTPTRYWTRSPYTTTSDQVPESVFNSAESSTPAAVRHAASSWAGIALISGDSSADAANSLTSEFQAAEKSNRYSNASRVDSGS